MLISINYQRGKKSMIQEIIIHHKYLKLEIQLPAIKNEDEWSLNLTQNLKYILMLKAVSDRKINEESYTETES